MSYPRCWVLRVQLLTVWVWSLASVPAVQGAEDALKLTFEQNVRPILKARCFPCHGEEEKPKAKLDLRLARLLRQGGRSGEAIVAGRHEESLLWERIEADEMPPGEKKLSTEEKATIAAWIDQGGITARPEPESLSAGADWTEEERAFWSFQPIRRTELPTVLTPALVRTPIDAFLLERLESQGVGFSPEADRRTLIRRLSFDLTGLPPTPVEVDAFVSDLAPDAVERLIERLLASPHYGERWARHWLDLAGYADSDGSTAKDPERKYAYKYRDYLVRSLNADRPWDELIREQLAGDELLTLRGQSVAPVDTEKLAATGFLRMAPDGTGDPEADPETAKNEVIAETIKIVSSSFLGLTVGCAQCHSHRYDPISHEDYYRFRALFEPAYDPKHWRVPNARLISLWTNDEREKAAAVDGRVKQIVEERTAAVEALVRTVLERELEATPEELREPLRSARETPKAKRTPEQVQLLKESPRINVSSGNVSLYDAKAHRALLADYAKRIEATKADRPAEDYLQALTEIPGQVPATYLFSRGDFQQPRQVVEPGELSVIAPAGEAGKIALDDPQMPTTGRRLAYARHLTSGQHPLVARVLVNRVWLEHFGRGLVNTPADFGTLGERPTHPALLDWLADEFMRGGWSLKKLHRTIMTSTAYRQSSRRNELLEAADADNRLIGRMAERRLDAESVRDAMLAVSGRLNLRMFGPPVPVAPDEAGQVIVGVDNRDSAGRPTGKRVALGVEEFRRSLYIQVRRSLPLSLLEVFDAPAMVPNCERRAVTTVAPQALLLMNNDFVVTQAEALAARVAKDAGDDPAEQVRLAWRLALSGVPDPAQVAAAVAFVEQQRDDLASGPKPSEPVNPSGSDMNPAQQALATFCQALMSSNAFLYVD